MNEINSKKLNDINSKNIEDILKKSKELLSSVQKMLTGSEKEKVGKRNVYTLVGWDIKNNLNEQFTTLGSSYAQSIMNQLFIHGNPLTDVKVFSYYSDDAFPESEEVHNYVNELRIKYGLEPYEITIPKYYKKWSVIMKEIEKLNQDLIELSRIGLF